MKRRYYIFIAVCSYLLFILANTPAAKVISLAKDNFNIPVQFYGVQGSIWNGQADSLLVQSNRIDQLKWCIYPGRLLLARISADIQAQVKQQNITGHVSIDMSGDIYAEDLRARMNAADVQKMINMPFGELGGIFNLDIESLAWSGNGLPATTATIKWRNAKLTLADTIDLGTVSVNIKPNNENGLSINMNNTGGMISIDGDIQLDSNKQYKLKIDFTAANNANTNINQSLAMFARKQSNGSYRFKQNGNLNQFGL